MNENVPPKMTGNRYSDQLDRGRDLAEMSVTPLTRPLMMDRTEELFQLLLNTCRLVFSDKSADSDLKGLLGELEAAVLADEKSGVEYCGLVCTVLERIIDKAASDSDREILLLLHKQVKDATFQAVRQTFRERLLDLMGALEKGGSSREVTVAMDLGLAASAFGLDALGGKVRLEYTFSAKAADSTVISDSHSVTGKLGLYAGSRAVACADASVAGTLGRGKVFTSIESYTDHHANDLLPLLFGQGVERKGGRLKTLRGIRKAREAIHSDVQVRAEQERLQTLLHARGVLAGDVRLVRTAADSKLYIDSRFRQVRGAVGVSALKGVLSAELSLSRTHGAYFKKESLLSTVKQSPERLAEEPEEYFSVQTADGWLQGGEGRGWIDAVGRQLAALQQQKNACDPDDQSAIKAIDFNIDRCRDQLNQAMASLYAEFEHYCSVVNNSDSALSVQARTIKHKMEWARGCKNRGEYLRAVIDTHAAMMAIYRDAAPSKQVWTDGSLTPQPIKKFEKGYQQPGVALDEVKHVRKHLSVLRRAESLDSSGGGDVTVTVGPAEVNGWFRFSEVESHYNPDNEGRYLNIGFSLGAAASPQAMLNAVVEAVPALASSVSGSISNVLSGHLDPSMINGAAAEVCLFWGGGGWRLQYVRVLAKNGSGVGTPELSIPVTAGLGVVTAMEAKVKASDTIWERIGSDTLSYLVTRFNGWASAGSLESHWELFVTEQHKAFAKLLHKLADRRSNPSKELDEMLKDMDEPGAGKELEEAVGCYHADPSESSSRTALTALAAFLNRYHRHHQKVVDSRFMLQQRKRK